MDGISFEGIKFWVSIHVPNTVKLDIKKRKGEIVRLERFADVVLVNEDKASANPDTDVSYRWVQECIRQNASLNENPFRVSELRRASASAGAAAAAPPTRTVYRSSSQPAQPSAPVQATLSHGKRVRIDYTTSDDQILTAWVKAFGATVANQDDNTQTSSGNLLYKELAKHCSHHTWSSWRERWTKKLAFVVDMHRFWPQTRQERLALQREVLRTVQKKHPVAIQEEEEEPVANGHREVQPSRLIPTRPPLAPPAEPEPESEQEQEPEPALHKPRPQTSARPSAKSSTAAADAAGHSGLCFLSTADLIIVRESARHGVKEPADADAFFAELSKKYAAMAMTPEAWGQRYHRLRDWYASIDVYDQQPAADHSEVHNEQAVALYQRAIGDADASESGSDMDDSDNGASDDAALFEEVEAQEEEQTKFRQMLDGFSEASEFIPRAFLIAERLLDTWTLWKTVQTVAPDPVNRDWAAVVASLGFDTARHPTVERDLASWYRKNLADGEAFLLSFPDFFSASNADTQSSLRAKRAREEAFGHDGDEDEGTPGGSRKRLRVNDGEDHGTYGLVDLVGLVGESGEGEDEEDEDGADGEDDDGDDGDGADGKGGEGEEGEDGDEDEEDGDDDSDNDSFETRTPTHRHAVKPSAAHGPASEEDEPETQDFAYGPATQRVAPAMDITPSEQLHTEEDVVMAIPLTLPGRRPVRASDARQTPSASALVPRASRRSLPASLGQPSERL